MHETVSHWRLGWPHAVVSAALFLLLPWMTVQTIDIPDQVCHTAAFVDGLGGLPVPCQPLITTQSRAPISLLWTDTTSTNHLVRLVPDSLLLAPFLCYAAAALLVRAHQLYGDSWQRVAAFFTKPSPTRLWITFLGTLSLWGYAFQLLVTRQHPTASDDTLAPLMLPVLPFWLATNAMALPLLHAAQGILSSWGIPVTLDGWYAADVGKEVPRSLTDAGFWVMVPLLLLTWYLLSALLAAFVRAFPRKPRPVLRTPNLPSA